MGRRATEKKNWLYCYSVGIVRSRTKATEFFFFLVYIVTHLACFCGTFEIVTTTTFRIYFIRNNIINKIR